MTAAITDDTLTRDEAVALTGQIREAMADVWSLIAAAYRGRAWTALGHATWDDYCAAEFGTSRLQVPREDRAEIVGSLRQAGLSVRAIEAATGLGTGTVHRSLSGVPTGTPEPITGRDGRRYRRTDIETKRRRRTPKEPDHDGVTIWSRRVQAVSADCPMSELTATEVRWLGGAAEFLFNYCTGELIERDRT